MVADGSTAGGLDPDLVITECALAHLDGALDDLLRRPCAGCPAHPGCPRYAEARLSPREQDVARHVARGMSSKQIAAALGIGLRTVNTYRESLARKLGGSSAAVITRYVLEHGLDR